MLLNLDLVEVNKSEANEAQRYVTARTTTTGKAAHVTNTNDAPSTAEPIANRVTTHSFSSTECTCLFVCKGYWNYSFQTTTQINI